LLACSFALLLFCHFAILPLCHLAILRCCSFASLLLSSLLRRAFLCLLLYPVRFCSPPPCCRPVLPLPHTYPIPNDPTAPPSPHEFECARVGVSSPPHLRVYSLFLLDRV
jgi:hypothetical protein